MERIARAGRPLALGLLVLAWGAQARADPAGTGAYDPSALCGAAGHARDDNAPSAAGLTAQCLASGGQLPGPSTSRPTLDEYAYRGRYVAGQNPLLAELRRRQPPLGTVRGYDIALGASEGQYEWGPGKAGLMDSLPAEQQAGFRAAMSLSLDLNRNAQLAAIGRRIAASDPVTAQARVRDPDVRYWLGFDVAGGIFGPKYLGAQGNTSTGTGSDGIRDRMSEAAQRGFRAAVEYHLARHY